MQSAVSFSALNIKSTRSSKAICKQNVDVRKGKRGRGKDIRGGNCVCRSSERYVACVIDGTATIHCLYQSQAPHVLPLFPVGGNAGVWGDPGLQL